MVALLVQPGRQPDSFEWPAAKVLNCSTPKH
jgi:hypothetical protein